jgi:hypothetical protein
MEKQREKQRGFLPLTCFWFTNTLRVKDLQNQPFKLDKLTFNLLEGIMKKNSQKVLRGRTRGNDSVPAGSILSFLLPPRLFSPELPGFLLNRLWKVFPGFFRDKVSPEAGPSSGKVKVFP